MWVSQATLDAQQAAIHERDQKLAGEASVAVSNVRELIAPLMEEAHFQALPAHHPFRGLSRLRPTLASYDQPGSRILEWIALSGAVRALLDQEVATRWLMLTQPERLRRLRQLTNQEVK